MHFTIEIETEHLSRALAAARQALEPDALLPDVGEMLYNKARARHERALAPDGTPWKPLAMGGRRVLHDTGEMLANLHPDVSGNILRIGFDIDRAAWHHFGTRPYVITPRKAAALAFNGRFYRRVKHPGLTARPLIGFPEDDARDTGDRIAELLREALDDSGGG